MVKQEAAKTATSNGNADSLAATPPTTCQQRHASLSPASSHPARSRVSAFNMEGSIFVFLFGCLLASQVLAETCQKPEVVASGYITKDATVLSSVAFTTQFVLKCSNGVKGITLYAEVDGKPLPAARLSADNKYQVSWTEDAQKAKSGDYNIKLYDEEKYAAVRKAYRNGEDPSTVKPLAVVVLNNPGVYLGPWLNSEHLAAFLAALVSYAAFSAKYKLLA